MAKEITDKAVLAATGKTRNYWREHLGGLPAGTWEHKKIVTYLRETHEISHWWAQTITVDFEKFIGRRILGQTKDAGFQIGVRKTVPRDPEVVWDLLISPKGSDFWLGPGELQLEPNKVHTLSNGTQYEFRVIKPGTHMRLRWKLSEWKNFSILQVRVEVSKSRKSVIAVHQEKLADEETRADMKAHWRVVLDKLALILKE